MKEYQQTIKEKICFSGTGLHSGKDVRICICPAPPDRGIIFIRKDIASEPEIPALVRNVSNTLRGTSLSFNGFEVKTVEHILSALWGLNVDNVFIEVSGVEIPIMDGSSMDFVKTISSAGLTEQEMPRKYYISSGPFWISQNNSYIILLPYNGFKITYVIHYDHPVIKTQMEEIEIEPRTYIEHISQSRTYGFTEEIEYLLKNNLALGGNLENAVIIEKDKYSSPLRFDNEPVKHKILDLIGDVALLGYHIKGHIIAIKSSHKLNIELVNKIKNSI
jgi:UDP-3-O-[3-hydroxymyristoyl] N-acetylglucosamine deacetylase